MPSQTSLEIDAPTHWRLSAKWGAHEIDCTLHGIQNGCGAKCCNSTTFWPSRTGEGGRCPNLGPAGCRLGDDRPVTCLLYPFRLKGASLGLHGRTLLPGAGACAPCHHRGGRMIVEQVRSSLAALFGEEQAELVIENTRAGRDTILEVPPETLAALEAERVYEERNETPPGRSEMVGAAVRR